MSMAEAQFTREEMEMVLRSEYELRTHYRVLGELDESSKRIEKLKAQILLACGQADSAHHFFELLDKDSKKVDFLAVYQAGKDSRTRGESLRYGLYHCLRALALDRKCLEFERDLQQTFNELTERMPDDITAMYPNCLLKEYKATFCGVNKNIKKFFRLGYKLRVLKLDKHRLGYRYQLISKIKAGC